MANTSYVCMHVCIKNIILKQIGMIFTLTFNNNLRHSKSVNK